MRSQPEDVTLDGRGLVVGGRRTPLVAGSLEYWRVNSLHWRKCLREMRNAGLEQVSSFVCWEFHELDDGSLDFHGRTHPSRDLGGFIDLCAEEGFDYLVRVGPIIDAEWPTRGPIEEVCRLERIDPLYRRRTEEYLHAVLEILVPRLATNGGPVILLSVDNEPYYPYSTDEESDPSEGSIHVPYHRDLVLAHYKAWLSDRYASDEGLSAAWNMRDVSLDRTREPAYRSDSPEAVLDSFAHITDVIADTYAWMRDVCRERGVDIPIYSNMKQFSHYIDWCQIEQVVDGHGLGAFFPNLLRGDQALVASWYIRVQRAVTRFPWAAEFQGVTPMGLDEVFGSLADNHQRYMTELALAMGLRGLCYYVFVERDDAQYAPISPIGKVRPRLNELSRAIALAKSLQIDEQVADVGLLWTVDHHRLAIAERFDDWQKLYHLWIEMDSPKELPAWWSAFRELHDADADFAVVSMRSGERRPVLLYAGPDAVRTSDWKAVVERVEEGATLVARALPTKAFYGDATEIAELNHRIESTGRLVAWRDEPVTAPLERAGARWAIRSGEPEIWTTAYRTEHGFLFFVVNHGEEERATALSLGELTVSSAGGAVARDLETAREWEIAEESLTETPVVLAPKQVLAVVIQPPRALADALGETTAGVKDVT